MLIDNLTLTIVTFVGREQDCDECSRSFGKENLESKPVLHQTILQTHDVSVLCFVVYAIHYRIACQGYRVGRVVLVFE